MEFICKDSFHGGDWMYDAASKKYMRHNPEGTIKSISGKYLPDPWKLWQKRAFLAGVTPTGPKGLRMKPEQTTFDLWKHWREVDCIAEETNEARQKG